MKVPKGLDPQFFQNEMSRLSMMRLITYHGASTGRVMIFVGLVFQICESFVFKQTTANGIVIVGMGVGMFGLGEGAKALQAMSEQRK